MAPSDDALSELLYGAILLDDGVKYYADWASAMQREFHGAASRLPRIFELAQELARFDIVQRPERARQLLDDAFGARDAQNPYASPTTDEPIVARTVEEHVNSRETHAALEERVRDLERRLSSSMLHSDRFGLRVLAVFGHWAIAYLLIALAIGIVAVLFGLAF